MSYKRVPLKKERCVICKKEFYCFGSSGCTGVVCDAEQCLDAFATSFEAPKKERLVQPGEVQCHREGCSKHLSPGIYKTWNFLFCSYACSNNHYSRNLLSTTCKNCQKPLIGLKCSTKLYCDTTCWLEYRNKTSFEERAGVFTPVLLRYLEGDAKIRYKKTTWRGVRSNLALFFLFARIHGAQQLSDIDPGFVTDFMIQERAHGLQHDNYVSQISVFFNWVRMREDAKISNPVLPDWHAQRQASPRPRPYSEAEVSMYWEALEGNAMLRLAFAIGLESGLRVSEVANIRIEDINVKSQSLFVRLPNKGDKERVTRFREMTITAFQQWINERDVRCPDNHLLHNTQLRPYVTSTLDQTFADHFEEVTGKESTFCFHRLRHTWATILLNNGIDPIVLMELGGWKSWQSMQYYIQLLQSTIDTSYLSAVESYRKQKDYQPEKVVGLMAFALSQGNSLLSDSQSTT